MNIIHSVKEVGFTGFLDISFMSLVIYTVIIGFKRTRAAFVLTGIFITAAVYVLARQFNLVMTTSVFEKFFAVILIIMIIIFQEELKHFFEEIAVWSLNRRLLRKKMIVLSRSEVETLVRTVMDFAREKIGALIVLKGKDILSRHLDGEISLNGDLSEALLKSIFDPHSAGHDGAVIIDGNRVTHFACYLPLSKHLSLIKNSGTRHAAALGMSEVSDALCLVVSEERGAVSVTRNGTIQAIDDPDKLTLLLQKFYAEINPIRRAKPWEEFFKKNTPEKVYAALAAVGLWFVFVHGAVVTYKSFIIPVTHAELPEEWGIAAINPEEIEVTVRGPRTSFYFNVTDRIKVYMDMKIVKGPQSIRLYKDNFTVPKGLIVEHFDPEYIEVTLDKKQKELKKNVKPIKIETYQQ